MYLSGKVQGQRNFKRCQTIERERVNERPTNRSFLRSFRMKYLCLLFVFQNEVSGLVICLSEWSIYVCYLSFRMKYLCLLFAFQNSVLMFVICLSEWSIYVCYLSLPWQHLSSPTTPMRTTVSVIWATPCENQHYTFVCLCNCTTAFRFMVRLNKQMLTSIENLKECFEQCENIALLHERVNIHPEIYY